MSSPAPRLLPETERLACRVLELVHPDDLATHRGLVLELGTFSILESDVALDAVIDDYLTKLKIKANEIATAQQQGSTWRPRHQSDPYQEAIEKLGGMAVLSYPEFQTYNGRGDTERRRETPEDELIGAAIIRASARKTFASFQRSEHYESSRTGYRKYLRHALPEVYQKLSHPLPALVPEAPRREHSYIIATNGVGKSELLKAHILGYTKTPECGVVLIDPGGDMAEQIAKWPELIPTGRLVYIDPFLDRNHVPVINPFDADGLDDDGQMQLAEQIVAAIGSLVEGKKHNGGIITPNMLAALRPSVRLLVDTPGADLRDLHRLMKDDAELVELGTRSRFPDVAEFFATEFTGFSNFKSTKEAVAIKIGGILGVGPVASMLCGRSTVPLERLANEGKIILFNLAKGRLTEAGSAAIGTLVVSMMQAIAMRRVNTKEFQRAATHLVIDECHNIVTSEIATIIREGRKFGIPITLSQQNIGGGMPEELASVVSDTTNVKVIGRTGPGQVKEGAAMARVEADAIDTAGRGEFFYKNGTAPAFKLHVRTDRLKDKGGMPPAMWQAVRAQQLRHFYHSTTNPTGTGKTKPPTSDNTQPDTPQIGGTPDHEDFI